VSVLATAVVASIASQAQTRMRDHRDSPHVMNGTILKRSRRLLLPRPCSSENI
jgi:hypothetical protein